MSATNASWSPSSPLLHKTTVPLTPDTYQLVQRCVYALEDVVRGELWAYTDESRRQSKRQKDLADLMRLAEANPEVRDMLPPAVARQLD